MVALSPVWEVGAAARRKSRQTDGRKERQHQDRTLLLSLPSPTGHYSSLCSHQEVTCVAQFSNTACLLPAFESVQDDPS